MKDCPKCSGEKGRKHKRGCKKSQKNYHNSVDPMTKDIPIWLRHGESIIDSVTKLIIYSGSLKKTMKMNKTGKANLIIPKKYLDYAKKKGWVKEEKGKTYLMKGIGAPYEIKIINQ